MAHRRVSEDFDLRFPWGKMHWDVSEPIIRVLNTVSWSVFVSIAYCAGIEAIILWRHRHDEIQHGPECVPARSSSSDTRHAQHLSTSLSQAVHTHANNDGCLAQYVLVVEGLDKYGPAWNELCSSDDAPVFGVLRILCSIVLAVLVLRRSDESDGGGQRRCLL